MKNIKRVAILVALLFLLAACGGGNSAVLDLGSAESSEPEPSETPTPVPATTTSASNPGVRSYNCLNDTSFKNLQADIAKQETTVETSPAGDKANEEDKLEALKARLAECEKEREASEPTCATWVRSDSDKTGNRWFANGIPAIAEASTDAEAREASVQWLESVKADPIILAGASRYVLERDIQQDVLFDEEGCATPEAEELVAELEVALSLSQITPEEAPADGYNSGATSEQVVTASQPGVSGDRKAILIVLPDGRKAWVLGRCGQIVMILPPTGVPSGPTDEPEPELPPPGQEPPPSGEQPPPSSQPGKNQADNIDRNPHVPSQTKGPGTTPVGTSPGPAEPVQDTPNGCRTSPCGTTGTEPQPKPAPTQAPRPDPLPPVAPPHQDSGPGASTPGPPATQTEAPAPAPPKTEAPVEPPPAGPPGG